MQRAERLARAAVLAIAAIVVVSAGDLPAQSTVDLRSSAAPARMFGEIAGDTLGMEVAVGDVNGDGLDDAVVAAPVMDGGPPGAIYVLYQRPGSLSRGTVDLAVERPDLTINGAHGEDILGHGLACGDVNGDGFDDIVFSSSSYGSIYVVYGKRFPSRHVINLASTPANITILKNDPGYGAALACGDLNHDGVDDILIGSADDASPAGTGCGGVEVVYGSKRLPSRHHVIDLNTVAPDAAVYGETPGDKFGYSVAAGDVNGDGIADLIAGAVWARPGGRYECGKVFVISGARFTATPRLDLSVSLADIEIWGEPGGWAFGNHLGWRVAAGDVNGDGVGDVVTSTPWASPTAARGNAGKIYVLFGDRRHPCNLTVDLSVCAANLTVHGRNAGDNLGYSLACGNIIKDDAYEDIIVGARGADPLGRTNAGAVYALLGRPWKPFKATLVDLNVTAADTTVMGAEPDDFAGTAVAAGRRNPLGKSPLVIGAPYASPKGRVDAGMAYAF
jgi:hypothetical protein